MRITELLQDATIDLGVKVNSKEEAIDHLVDLMVKGGNITDREEYKKGILAREANGTTGIGGGIAIPHSKNKAVTKAGLASMTVPDGVDYEAMDGEPSDVFFMIAAPAEGSDVHLEALSRLSVILMDPVFKDSLLKATSKEEYLALIDKKETEKFPEEAAKEEEKPAVQEEKADDGTILNQLDLIVKPTAFSTEHVEYVVKAKYVDIPNSGEVYPDVNVEYTVFVTYPNAVAPEITKLNWQDPGTNGEGGLIYAHGRIAPGADGKVETTDDEYDMVAVLNNMFDLEKYTMDQMLKPRTGETAYDLATIAKPTLSFELVDKYNSSSDWAGTTDGLKLYQENGVWKIELEKSDAGRQWINAIGEDSKRVKIRAVVSFNECYDGLYGTCNNGEKKYNKDQASDNLPECKTTDKVGSQAHDMHDYTGTAKAPEYGRSQVVIKEFEVAFITPIRFVKKTIDPLYDKYPLAENKAYLKDCFRLADYLSDENAAQEGFRYNHIVYDTDLTDQGTIDLFKRGTDGWCNYWKQVYDVNSVFEYKVIGGFFSDGTALDTENSKKIKFETDAEGEYVTWINDGEDIANEFVIKVEVCVKHVWGLVCNHANKETERGHSVVTLEIPVKFHKN